MSKPKRFRRCFINDGSCSQTIISAHTLSQSASMKLIQGLNSKNQNVVIQVGAKSKDNIYEPKEIGWSVASRYHCFCVFHDDRLFKKIENGNEFDSDNYEQLFLHTLRSFAFCYYKKKEEIDPENKFTDGFIGTIDEVTELMPKDSLRFKDKESFDKYNLHIQFSGYERIRVRLIEILKSQEYTEFIFRKAAFARFPFASAGTLMAEIVDFKTKKLSSTFMDPSTPIQHKPGFILTIVPGKKQTFLIGAALKADNNAAFLLRKFDVLGKDKLPSALSSLLLTANKENTFFHPKLWEYMKSNGYDKKIISEINIDRSADTFYDEMHQSQINLFSKEFSCENLGIN